MKNSDRPQRHISGSETKLKDLTPPTHKGKIKTNNKPNQDKHTVLRWLYSLQTEGCWAWHVLYPAEPTALLNANAERTRMV